MKEDTVRNLLELCASQIDAAKGTSFVNMTPVETKRFQAEHPRADFVVGDFEIRYIGTHREIYGLDP